MEIGHEKLHLEDKSVKAIGKWASESSTILKSFWQILIVPCKEARVAIPSKFMCGSVYSSVQVQYYFLG